MKHIIKTIYYYGRGYIDSEGVVFVKESDYKYWKECVSYYDEVYLVLYKSKHLTSSSEYSSLLDDVGSRYSLFDINGLINRIVSFFSILRIILGSPRGAVHFFYFPNSFNVWLFLVSRWLDRKIVSYWGNDWERVGELLVRQAGVSTIYPYLYGNIQRSFVRTSDVSFFAGKQLYDKFIEISRIGVETKPFISIDASDVYDRRDTCSDEVVRILYVGTFTQRKGILDLLQISEKSEHEGVQLEFVLVGAGMLDAYIREWIGRRNLCNRVVLAGYIGDKNRLLEYYRNSDIFILPSYMEGFPRVLYEAMSQGLPIVSTDVGSVPVLLKNRLNAFLCAPGDIECMISGINNIISDLEARQKMIEHNKILFNEIVAENPALQHSSVINSVVYDGK